MNISPGRRKQLVNVEATHMIDGSIELKKIIMADGQSFEIEASQDPYSEKAKPTGTVHRYPITIHGQQTYLFEDGGRWWVLMKQ